jgi:phage major head subunit gpT-like protein
MDINFETMDDFHQTISTKFFNALAAAPATEYTRISSEIPSTSSRNTYPFLGEVDDMREWIGPRIIRQLKSHRYSIDNRKFELTLSAQADEIADDQGGAVAIYGALAEIKARSVALQPDQLMMGEIVPGGTSTACYDGQNFFDTDHPVGSTTVSNDMGGSGTSWYLLDLSKPLKPFIYQNRESPVFAAMTDFSNPHVFMNDEFVWGIKRRNAGGYGLWQTAVHSKQTLNETNLRLAISAMNAFENDEGRKMGMNPTLLLVPLSLQFIARDLLELQIVSDGAGAGISNRVFKTIPYMVSSYL